MMQLVRDDVTTIRTCAGPVPAVLLADGAPERWLPFEQQLDERHVPQLEIVAARGN
jgi:hypothetical protein